MVKAFLVVSALVVFFSASPSHADGMDDWNPSPKAMKELVDEGYEIKSGVSSGPIVSSHEGPSAPFFAIYILQKGTSVYKCMEIYSFQFTTTTSSNGTPSSTMIQPLGCQELVLVGK